MQQHEDLLYIVSITVDSSTLTNYLLLIIFNKDPFSK